jgi:hypothetical protein
MNRTLFILLFAVSAPRAEPANSTSPDLPQPHRSGKNQGRQSAAQESAEKLLESRIKAEKEVVFIPWNGQLPEDGSRCTLRFQQGSQIRLDFVGYGIDFFFGSFSFINGSLIEAKIKDGAHRPYIYWPRMVLRRDGEDLLLYREDGKTWWHDIYPEAGKPSQRDTWPFYPKSIDGFWPLRATRKNRAEPGGNPK